VKVVLDTNVLWVSVSRRSASHFIFKALLEGRITLCVTTDILEEYEEIIGQMLGGAAAEAVMATVENLPNIVLATRYYRWLAIVNDPDDDKFVDCAVAANAVCIVTEDRHFNVLRTKTFPTVTVLTIEQFRLLLDQNQSLS
jgi:uncharacterized protein